MTHNFALHGLKIWIHLFASEVWFWFKFYILLMYRSGRLLLWNTPLWEDKMNSVPQHHQWLEIGVSGPSHCSDFHLERSFWRWPCKLSGSAAPKQCYVPLPGISKCFPLAQTFCSRILCKYSERMIVQWHRTQLWYWSVLLLHNI